MPSRPTVRPKGTHNFRPTAGLARLDLCFFWGPRSGFQLPTMMRTTDLPELKAYQVPYPHVWRSSGSRIVPRCQVCPTYCKLLLWWVTVEAKLSWRLRSGNRSVLKVLPILPVTLEHLILIQHVLNNTEHHLERLEADWKTLVLHPRTPWLRCSKHGSCRCSWLSRHGLVAEKHRWCTREATWPGFGEVSRGWTNIGEGNEKHGRAISLYISFHLWELKNTQVISVLRTKTAMVSLSML